MVNVTDYKAPQPGVCKLTDIFVRQQELMKKYHPIEEANGLMHDSSVPVDIHHRMGQHRLKDFAWRFTEEVAEAVEALDRVIQADYTILTWDPAILLELRKSGEMTHFHEEMIDAMHFLTELTILSGVAPQEIVRLLSPEDQAMRIDALDQLFSLPLSDRIIPHDASRSLRGSIAYPIYQLGKAMNCLKNKPWKQSHMLTDTTRYTELLSLTWLAFINALHQSGLNADQTFDLYFRKSEVNKFRQRSQY